MTCTALSRAMGRGRSLHGSALGSIVFLGVAFSAVGAGAVVEPRVGNFSDADLERARAGALAEPGMPGSTSGGDLGSPSTEPAPACVAHDEGTHDPLRSGTYIDNDTAHYARGSVLTLLVFVNHDGGTWSEDERNEQGAKCHLAKQFFLDHAPSEGFLIFDHQGTSSYDYLTADLPYDINDFEDFENWMMNDAAEALGFEDEDGDDSAIDDMNLWLQASWSGGWDNVIPVFIPADYNFSSAMAGITTTWVKMSRQMSYGTWAHEFGHVFGACDEGGSPSGCNDVLCDETCQSWYLVDQVPNGNCFYCTEGVPCVMRDGWIVDPPCSYTFRHWAWVDANGDGRLDNTIGWDPYAEDLYTIWELPHPGWMIHTNETWGMVANQKWTSWSAMGVRSRGASDWSISVFGDNNRNHHLASEFLAPGVRFVVGDFNHNNLGQDHIRLINTGGVGQYVLAYEAGTQMLFADGVERDKSWNGGNVVRAFDVPLIAGETIQFQLDIDTTELDLGMALFKSNGGTYYAPRSNAVREADTWPAGISETFTYTVPEDDVYGLVIWSETEVDGDFSIKIGPTLVQLEEADPYISFLDLKLFSYAPSTNYWAVSAVRPGASSNVRLQLYAESTFETWLATSGAYPNVEFIAADYNPGFSTDYLRVLRQSGANPHTTEWEQGSDLLAGFEENTWESGHICKVWDAYLVAGQEYRVQQYGALFSLIDAGIYLMSSAGGDRYIQRSGAAAGSNGLSPMGEWFTYTSPADDFYGLVMINNDESAGDYSIGVGPYEVLEEQVPVEFPDELIWADLETRAGSWAVVGVRPEPGSKSSIWLWDCEDRFLSCFLDGDALGESGRYLVIDGNHAPAQTWYVRADRDSGVGSQVVSFDIAPADIVVDEPEEVQISPGSFVQGEVVQVRDVSVAVAPVTLDVMVTPLSADLDLSIAIFGSGGGQNIQESNQALQSADGAGAGGTERLTWNVTSRDVYGLVIVNRSGAAGGYEIVVHRSGLTDAGNDADRPRELDLRALGSVSERPSLELTLPEASLVELDIFDVAGRRVRTLANEPLNAGVHRLTWDGKTVGGDAAGAGVYFARLRALKQEMTVRLVQP